MDGCSFRQRTSNGLTGIAAWSDGRAGETNSLKNPKFNKDFAVEWKWAVLGDCVHVADGPRCFPGPQSPKRSLTGPTTYINNCPLFSGV